MPTTTIQMTSAGAWTLAPRLIAGAPLLVLGAKHFIDPDHFRRILEASALPMIDVSLVAAPGAECLAGLLLLLGLYCRIGGLAGIATMAPAIYSTMAIAKLPAADRPFVPPLPLPIAVLICAAVLVIVGAGRWSVDHAMTKSTTE